MLTAWRRLRGTPKRPRLLVHCCHHRVGTLWFSNILSEFAAQSGLRFFKGSQSELPEDADIFLQDHSRVAPRQLPSFRGTHIIRDPRDIAISGYFFHRTCDEDWCLAPQEKLGGQSYQSVLTSLDQNEGIAFEMRQTALVTYRDMLRWRYKNRNFLEIRYEDLIADESRSFTKIFEHYQLTPSQKALALDIALSYSFERVTRRPLGQTVNGAHLRNGRAGQWRDYFTAEHLALSRQLFGRGLRKLGYPDA